MRTYSIDKDRVSYIDALDILYVGYGDGCLDYCESIEDVEPGITVMTNGGEFAGAEIYDFKKTFGDLPARIEVDSSSPFILEIPA